VAGTKRSHGALSGNDTRETCNKENSFRSSDRSNNSGGGVRKASGTQCEFRKAPPRAQMYTGPYGSTIDTSLAGEFCCGMGLYPAQLYVREEFARVFEIVTEKVSERSPSSSTVRQLKIVGSAGVGKSVLLLSVCMNLWRQEGRNVFVVRRFNKHDGLFRGPNSVFGGPLPDQYAVFQLEASQDSGGASVVNTVEEAEQLYHSFVASCSGGHILAVDDREEDEGIWQSNGTAQYFLCTRSELNVPALCGLGEASSASAHSAVSEPQQSAQQAATGAPAESSRPAQLVLLPGWALSDLKATAPHIDDIETDRRQYVGGGSLTAFQERSPYTSKRTLEQVAEVRYGGAKSVDDLRDRQLGVLSCLYVTDIGRPESYTDRQNWLMLFDVGLALPGIAHVLSVDAMRASLDMAIKLKQPSWIEGAMCGYMHQLAREKRLTVTLKHCDPDGTAQPGEENIITVTTDGRFEAACDRHSSCVSYLHFVVRDSASASETRYWHPIRWVDGPVHAVLCCPAQKIVVLLRCAPFGPVVFEEPENLREVLDNVCALVPPDYSVVLAAVVPDEYRGYGEKVCFEADNAEQLPQGRYCVGTFGPA
jgi:hypothetical protein